ncbi:response regulator [Bosea sp. (in: a-proteobacteria)]|uniref:ANTAR domain-containing response regulator n=1 Tax=Bosea sp. (in: a-proteobacteria) TaxID=1871050 RepID=UPI0025B93A9E|nr:response regulator [Bosea sp. (in: a-proteobacteria)]
MTAPNADEAMEDETTKTVMIVDDDPLILTTMRDGLQRAGYDVWSAGSAEEALELTRDAMPDAALIDMRMPGMSGLELAETLLDRAPVAVVFLSAYDDLELVREAATQGAYGYLVKPALIRHIVPAIEAAMVRARDVAQIEDEQERLRGALEGQQEISVAVGIMMERHRMSRNAAFNYLRSEARSQRRKLRDVANEYIAAEERLNRADD